MNYDEYRELRHARPYKLKLKSGPNFLFYFGERHSFDPADTQWTEERDFWNEFIQETKGLKKIIFTEGGLRPVEATEEQAIVKHGGMGLATFWGEQEKIQRHSPEPDESYERAELEKHFLKEHIQYYYFARVVHQWGLQKEYGEGFGPYIQRYLEGDKKESNWLNFDFSLEAMKRIHVKMFGKEFDENDTEFFYEIINPVFLKTEINKVSRASSEIRDEYIVQQIKKYMDEGYSIFAQYGCSHVVMQEPLLREIL